MSLQRLPLHVISKILLAMAFRIPPLIYIVVDAAVPYRIDVRPYCSHLYLKRLSGCFFWPPIRCVTADGSYMVRSFFCFNFFSVHLSISSFHLLLQFVILHFHYSFCFNICCFFLSSFMYKFLLVHIRGFGSTK